MAFREYNTRGTRSRQPLHLRIYDRVRDLNDNYRLGWLLLFAVVVIGGHRLITGRPWFGGGMEYWEHIESSHGTGTRIKDGRELAAAAEASTEEWFHAVTTIEGLGNNVLVTVETEAEKGKVTPAQAAAFDHFAAMYSGLKPDAVQAMFDAYVWEREDVLSHMPDAEEEPFQTKAIRTMAGIPSLKDIFPDLKSPEELEKLLHAPAVHLFEPESDGLAYLALSFTPQWSVNPFGAILHGDRVLWAGSHPDEQYDILAIDSGEEPPDADWAEDPRSRPALRRPFP